MTKQIATALCETIQPRGVGVVVEAKYAFVMHICTVFEFKITLA